MENKLVKVINESGLEKTQSEKVLSGFQNYFEQASEWEKKAKELVVTDESQTDLMKKAREARLVLKNIRVEADKKRKDMKEQSIREGNAIQGMYNIIKAIVVPLEEHLEKQEKFIEIKEAIELEKKVTERIEKLSLLVEDVSAYNLRDLTDNGFNELLGFAKEAKDKKEAEAKAIEEARLASAKKEEEERLEMIKENERLKKIAEEKEKELEKERELQLAKEKKEREIREKKEKEEAEARLKLQNELKKKEEEEAKRLRAIEDERLKKEKEEKEKQLAPDKDKLVEFSRGLDSVEIPSVESDEARLKLNEALKLVNQAQLILKSL